MYVYFHEYSCIHTCASVFACTCMCIYECACYLMHTYMSGFASVCEHAQVCYSVPQMLMFDRVTFHRGSSPKEDHVPQRVIYCRRLYATKARVLRGSLVADARVPK